MSAPAGERAREVPGLAAAIGRDCYAHCLSARGEDVGGVLVGRLTAGGPPVVEATMRGGDPQSERDGGRFPYGCLRALRSEVDQRFPGQVIVGWYGQRTEGDLRLSDRDRALHRELFGDPGQIAVLIDSARAQGAVFRWRGAALVEHQRMPCAGAAGAPARRPTPSRRRGTSHRTAGRPRLVVEESDVRDVSSPRSRGHLETALYLAAIAVSIVVIVWEVLPR